MTIVHRVAALLVITTPVSLIGGCGGDETPLAWSPPAVCSLPFDPGSCGSAFPVPVFAYVDGACVTRSWGGCQGNGNRFVTLEECMATCLGLPNPNGCTSDRVKQRLCLACGPAGACGRDAEVCAKPCTAATDCGGPLSACRQGVCQVSMCD
jgi:hypothetical protein